MEEIMKELSNKILKDYQIRKTRKQKTEFIELLQKELNKEVIIEEGGILKSRNIIVGDLENSKIVLGAHYDTQPVLPFPNFLTPKNMIVYILYMIVFMFIFLGIQFLFEFIIIKLTNNTGLGILAGLAWCIFFLGWMFVGKANSHTANDNTSGVLTLIEAIHDEELKDVCCVFFDHEELGLFGSAFFNKKHKDLLKDKLVFNFDCVGDGDSIMFVLSKTALDEENKLKESFVSDGNKEVIITKSSNTLYPSDQMSFKHHVGVAAFKKHKIIGYYMDKIHTIKDINCDENNIKFIINGLKEYMKRVDYDMMTSQ